MGPGPDPRPKPKSKTQRDPYSEFSSIHFGREIKKKKILRHKKFLGLNLGLTFFGFGFGSGPRPKFTLGIISGHKNKLVSSLSCYYKLPLGILTILNFMNESIRINVTV